MNSVKEANDGFKAVKGGFKSYDVKNKQLLEELRKIEKGDWKKVYSDGYDAAGNKASQHFFKSESGKIFDYGVKPGWSNL